MSWVTGTRKRVVSIPSSLVTGVWVGHGLKSYEAMYNMALMEHGAFGGSDGWVSSTQLLHESICWGFMSGDI